MIIAIAMKVIDDPHAKRGLVRRVGRRRGRRVERLAVVLMRMQR